MYGGEERCIQGLGGKSEGEKPLKRPRDRWEDNIRMDLHEIAQEDVDWIELAKDRKKWRVFVNTVINSELL